MDGTAGEGFGTALGRMAAELPRLDMREAGRLVGRLRAMAVAEGMTPVAELADGLAAALLRDRAGTPLSAWIEAMRHAATVPAGQIGAGPLLLATVGVRFGH